MALFGYLLVSVFIVSYCLGNRILTTDKKMPVLGQSLVLIYTSNEEDITGSVTFNLNESTQGVCLSAGLCGSGFNHIVTRQSTHVITLEISSFNQTKHAGTWTVTDTYPDITHSSTVILTPPFATAVDTSKIDFTDACPYQTDIDSQTDFAVSVMTGCAYPAVNISWNFFGETSVNLTPVTTTVSDGCTSPQVKTAARLTMNYLTVQGKVNVTTHLIHPSFNNDVYDKFICTAKFPIQVKEVTLLNISSHKDKIQVSEGFVSLTCVTSPSNPVSSVYWYKNNQQINTGITNIDITSGDLTVRKSSVSLTLTESDDGHSVYCKAGIPGQTLVTSNTGILDVWYPPSRPTLSSDPEQPWLENTGGSLICSLPDSGKGNPAAQFYWIRNGSDVQHTGSKLSLKPTKEDSGVWYKCSAGNEYTDRNGQQRPESEKKRLSIYYYPRIKITFSKSGLYKEGDGLTLTCTSDSNPSPAELKWTFDGQELVNNGKLILTNLNRTNHGNYTCEANVTTNKYGNLVKSRDAEVVVNYAPDITFDSLNTTENITANITCFADGRPGNMKFTSFKHYWNGVFIEDVSGVVVGNSQYRLMFKSATYEDGGTYTCSVNNGITDRSGKLS